MGKWNLKNQTETPCRVSSVSAKKRWKKAKKVFVSILDLAANDELPYEHCEQIVGNACLKMHRAQQEYDFLRKEKKMRKNKNSMKKVTNL